MKEIEGTRPLKAGHNMFEKKVMPMSLTGDSKNQGSWGKGQKARVVKNVHGQGKLKSRY